MADGRVEYEVRANDNKVNNDLDAANRKVEKGAAKIGATAKNIAVAVGTAIATSVAAAGAAATAFAVKGISIASDLAEVQNVIDVAFGDSADIVNDWSETATNAYGLAELSAKKYTGTMGAMLKSSGVIGSQMTEMSTTLAGLAGDFASFYNLSTDEAFDKIRAGIAGEVEPLRQLGINLSVANLDAYALKEGLGKTFNQMTQGEQTILRYKYLMSVTSDAQGDFARTSDSWANQLRVADLNLDRLSASLGAKLTPALSNVLKTFNDVVEQSNGDISVFIQNFDKVIDAGMKAADEILPVITSIAQEILNGLIKMLPKILDMGADIAMSLIDGVLDSIPQIANAIGQIAQKIITMLPRLIMGALKAIPDIITGIITGLLGIQAPINKLDQEIKSLNRSIDNLNKKIDDNNQKFQDTTNAINANAIAAEKLTNKLYALEQKENKSNSDKAVMKQLVDELNSMYSDLNLKLNENTYQVNQNENATRKLIQAKKDEATASAYMEKYKEALIEQAEADRARTDAANDYDAKLRELANRYGTTYEKIKNMVDKYPDQMSSFERDFLYPVTLAVEKAQNVYDKATDSVNYYSRAVDNKIKVVSAVNADLVDSIDEWNRKIEDAQQKHEDAMGSIYDYGLKKQKISLATAAKNIKKQVSDMISYRKNMKALQDMITSGAISQEVYDQLASEGTKAAGLIADLVRNPESKGARELIDALQSKAGLTQQMAAEQAGPRPVNPYVLEHASSGYKPYQSKSFRKFTEQTYLSSSATEAYQAAQRGMRQTQNAVGYVGTTQQPETVVKLDPVTVAATIRKSLPKILVELENKNSMVFDTDVLASAMSKVFKGINVETGEVD